MGWGGLRQRNGRKREGGRRSSKQKTGPKRQVDRKSNAEQQWYSQGGTSGYWINVSLDTRIKETSSKARSFRPHKNMKQDHIKA